MHVEETATNRPLAPSRTRHLAKRAAWIAAAALLCSLFLPSIPILLGMLILLAVTLHFCTPALQDWLHPLLRIPVAGPAQRRLHLTLVASAGVLLVAIGGVGATAGGHMRAQSQKRQRNLAYAEERGAEILLRAKAHLAAGELQAAELTLMEAEGELPIDPDAAAQALALLEKMRRSRDAAGILETLRLLPEEEFQALERMEAVPAALEFDERILTMQAVDLARVRMDEARRLRAAGGVAASDSR